MCSPRRLRPRPQALRQQWAKRLETKEENIAHGYCFREEIRINIFYKKSQGDMYGQCNYLAKCIRNAGSYLASVIILRRLTKQNKYC